MKAAVKDAQNGVKAAVKDAQSAHHKMKEAAKDAHNDACKGLSEVKKEVHTACH
jgi:hypothetical protein